MSECFMSDYDKLTSCRHPAFCTVERPLVDSFGKSDSRLHFMFGTTQGQFMGDYDKLTSCPRTLNKEAALHE